jgi:hypothetical protein
MVITYPGQTFAWTKIQTKWNFIAVKYSEAGDPWKVPCFTLQL